MKRPAFFESLCWLSFLGNAGGFLIYLTASLFFNRTAVLVRNIGNLQSMDGITPFYFILLAVFYLIAFWSVLRMWKFKTDGLVIYIILKLILLFFPAIWLGWQALSMTGVIFTSLFIVLYLTQVRKFKVIS